ncbi:hypothetical protein quinque_008419 [Culex quinquefasciatus]
MLPKDNPPSTTCDINLISWELEALAHIPGGSHSVNPFHNPYGPHFSCSFFIFFCREDQLAFGDLYLTPKVRPNMVCPGVQLIKMDHRAWQVEILSNPNAKACEEAEKWTTVDLVVYRQNQSIIMYGCKEHDKDNRVEIGAWILANRNGNDEMKQDVLDMGLELFDQIPEIKRNWWEFPIYSTDCLTELNCSYYADCVTKNDVMEMEREARSESEKRIIQQLRVAFLRPQIGYETDRIFGFKLLLESATLFRFPRFELDRYQFRSVKDTCRGALCQIAVMRFC